VQQAFMINTILLPTDGSVLADKAVSLAGELAKLYGAKIVLLHCVLDPTQEHVPKYLQDLANIESQTIGDVLLSVGEEILKRTEARIRAQGVENIETTIPSGRPAQAILDYAKAHPVDLIVMGSRGRSDLEGLILGSVSHKVSHLSPCSCVTVR
jgi:nucleotide-binding universal stress UspA family protein